MRILIFLLLFTISGYSAEKITEFTEEKLPVLNEELEKLDINTQIKINNGIDLNSKKITSVATPTEDTDGVNKSYVDTVDDTKADAGANTDITSLTGLTTALAVAYGGTGVTHSLIKATSYTGNGTSQNVPHGLGTTPAFVMISNLNGSDSAIIWISGFGGNGKNTSNAAVSSSYISGVNATNVSVGNSNETNRSGTTHYMVAIAAN